LDLAQLLTILQDRASISGVGAEGTATVDFGFFPGKSDAVVTVSAPGIATTSLVEAWILPNTTTDHSADEHMVS